MRKMSVGMAMGLLVVGNIVAVFSDALIKSVSQDVAVFQFVFFRQISAVMILLPFCLKQPKQLTQGLKWHALRAHVWLMGAIAMVYAVGSMSLATANAIFYAAPLMMLPLAVWMYKEKLSTASVMAGVLGFMGVLIIIRPTEITWGAIAALITAFGLAMNNMLIRKLPVQQGVMPTLLLTNLLGIPTSLALALGEGAPWDWSVLPQAVGATTCISIYAATCVLAYRAADSNKIASAEYSGLIGAVVVGILWFGEMPDWFMVIGSLFIVVPLIWLSKAEKRQTNAATQEIEPIHNALGDNGLVHNELAPQPVGEM
uniref:DMT family transporter n=1 Tax=Thaumasiovibrio occultus TaxID=1891184 RepID=UPI000B3578EC|nr:DMT family transporter [Thaumasiovibrio occultus]